MAAATLPDTASAAVPGKIGDLYRIELRDYDPDDIAGEVQEGAAAVAENISHRATAVLARA